MPTLDLTAGRLNFEFDKGTTFDPVIWCLNPDFTAVDLAGYNAEGEVAPDYDSAQVIWPLSTTTGGLKLAAATVPAPAVVVDTDGVSHSIADAKGFQFDISAALTAAVLWDRAYYDIRLIAPDGTVKAFARGCITVGDGGCC